MVNCAVYPHSLPASNATFSLRHMLENLQWLAYEQYASGVLHPSSSLCKVTNYNDFSHSLPFTVNKGIRNNSIFYKMG